MIFAVAEFRWATILSYCLILFHFSDELGLIDQDTGAKQSLLTGTEELQTGKSDNIAATVISASDRSQTANSQTESNLNRVLSKRKKNSLSSCRKKKANDRASSSLVCLPCKKHFNCRRTLEQHNQLVHQNSRRPPIS